MRRAFSNVFVFTTCAQQHPWWMTVRRKIALITHFWPPYMYFLILLLCYFWPFQPFWTVLGRWHFLTRRKKHQTNSPVWDRKVDFLPSKWKLSHLDVHLPRVKHIFLLRQEIGLKLRFPDLAGWEADGWTPRWFVSAHSLLPIKHQCSVVCRDRDFHTSKEKRAVCLLAMWLTEVPEI